MKAPCENCPFRRDVVFPLRVARVQDILDDITHNDNWFACHKTTTHEDEHVFAGSDAKHCAGAAILLDKIEQPNQMMRIMGRIERIDFSKLRLRGKVFDSITEMIDHYKKLNRSMG